MGMRSVKLPIPQYVEAQYLTCDDCECDMIDRMIILTSNPPQYSYECPKCHKIVNSSVRYANPGCDWIEQYKLIQQEGVKVFGG